LVKSALSVIVDGLDLRFQLGARTIVFFSSGTARRVYDILPGYAPVRTKYIKINADAFVNLMVGDRGWEKDFVHPAQYKPQCMRYPWMKIGITYDWKVNVFGEICRNAVEKETLNFGAVVSKACRLPLLSSSFYHALVQPGCL